MAQFSRTHVVTPSRRSGAWGPETPRASRLEYPIADEACDLIGARAPISVHSSLDGDHLVIERRLLERGARRF
jgi:hypothetical protein